MKYEQAWNDLRQWLRDSMDEGDAMETGDILVKMKELETQ